MAQGSTGNVIAAFPGTKPAEPVLLSAHMDTVVPGRGIKPIREADRIRTDGTSSMIAIPDLSSQNRNFNPSPSNEAG